MGNYTTEYLNATFQVIKKLHKSEKAEVFLVSNNANSQLYVMKYIKNINLPYKVLKEVSHPVLPKVIYVTEKENQTITVEEYINARNLNDVLIEDGNLNEQVVIDIALQICDGLEFLHVLNIIHRDIKPSNILFTTDGKIKLIDFDAARIEKDDACTDTRYLGTQGYAPPEQYGFAQTDNRSDIYALGITMKELLGASYHGNLLSVIEKCTKIDPENRFQSVIELKQAIKGANKPRWPVYVIGILILITFLGFSNMNYQKVNFKELVNPKSTSNINQLKGNEISDQTSNIEEITDKSDGEFQKVNDKERILPLPKENIQDNIIYKKKRSNKQNIKPILSKEISLSFQLNGRKYKDTDVPDIYLGPISLFVPNEEITKKYPEAKRFYSQDSNIYIELYNNSEIELLNPKISVLFSKVVFLEKQNDDTGNFYYNENLDGDQLYTDVIWKDNRIGPKSHISYSIPLQGAVIFHVLMNVIIAVTSDNGEAKIINARIYFID